MVFQDNILKEYLKNVIFIVGTPCGGKTTVSRALGKKHDIKVYDVDEMFPNHHRIADDMYQPAMRKCFKDADEFFGRSIDEYRNWLIKNTREQLDFIVLDLIRLSKDEKIICDCHMTLAQAEALTEPSRIAFMIKEPSNLVDDYCNRPDHQGFSEFIHSATDVEAAKKTCNETLQSLNRDYYKQVKHSKYFWLERSNERSVEQTVSLVEKHLGLKQ